MEMSNGIVRNSKELVEMNGVYDKNPRFQVNRVNNTPERLGDSNRIAIDSVEGEPSDEEEVGLHSVTDTTRLNSESDSKYIKSFR